MKLTMIALGTRGDVQPTIALGIAFQQAGYTVKIATHRPFEAWIRSFGLDYAPVVADPREVFSGDAGQDWIASGDNPLKMLWGLRQTVTPYINDMARDTIEATKGADALIFSIFGFLTGPSLMEALDIPAMGAYLQPAFPTASTPFMAAPPLPHNFPFRERYNMLTHQLVATGIDVFFKRVINRIRRDMLDLPPYRESFNAMLRKNVYPITQGFSPLVVPPAPDWPPHTHVSGYWFLDELDYQPPAELVDWLESDEPPVYIGFGSMMKRDPEATTDIILKAIERSGQRCLLLSGWGGFGNTDLPDHIYKIESVPHSWLFPQMAAVVHHGGAGTTAAGLRAGVPSIIVPHFGDQPFWARRVYELGVGTAPLPRSQLTPQRLAHAIKTTVYDMPLRRRAADFGEQIRAEDGTANAIRFFEDVVLKRAQQ